MRSFSPIDRVIRLFFLLLSVTINAHDLPGVRAKSFGGAFRAVATANDIIFYNAAGLLKHRRMGVDAQYLSYLDSGTHSMGISLLDASTSIWGLGLAYYLDIENRKVAAHLVDVALAFPIVKELLFLGGSFYYRYSALEFEDPHRHFFNMDVSIMACLPMGLSFAVALDHVIRPKGREKGMGLAVATALDLGSVWRGLPLTLSVDWLMDDVTSKDNLHHMLSFGSEYILFNVLPLRLGFKSKFWQRDNLISLGSGLLIADFAVDALFEQHLTIGKIRNFGIALRFNF